MTTVGKLTITPRGERELVLERSFDAQRELVFAAYTRPELVRRWLLGPPGWTMPVCEIDLRVGGAYRYQWQNDRGATMGVRGVFREVVPPQRLVTAEIFDEDWTGGEAIGTILFTEHAGRTTVTQTMLYSSREARDGALRSGMAEGMEMGFARLDEVLAKE